jgi:hypothetical protein
VNTLPTSTPNQPPFDASIRVPLPVRPLPAPPVEWYEDRRGKFWQLVEDGQERMFVLEGVDPSSCPRWVWASEADLTGTVGPLTRVERAA